MSRLDLGQSGLAVRVSFLMWCCCPAQASELPPSWALLSVSIGFGGFVGGGAHKLAGNRTPDLFISGLQ